MNSEKLHIAHFTNVYKPVINGVAISVESFRNALEKRGHQVYIYAPAAGDHEDEERFIVRYPSFELPMQKYPITAPVSSTADELIKITKPDVLHAHHPALLGRTALQYSDHYNIPMVFTYHTRYHDYAHYADPFPKERVGELITHWLGHFMSGCHRVVVPSESIKQMVSENYGLNDGVKVVPTGIDFDKFSSVNREKARAERGWPEEETVFVSIGRLAKEKNFDLLIRSVAKLPQDLSWRLVVLGEGDERENLETLADELGVASKVDLVGRVPAHKVPDYLAAADIFAFASVTETQGLVTLEAMATGLPVVAVKASGTSDVVESGEQGILTEVDADALAEGLRTVLESDDLQRKFSIKAQEKARLFTPDRQAGLMEEVYREAIDANQQGKTLHPSLMSHWEAFLEFLGLPNAAS